MARIRTIKPEFPQSESMGRVSRDARLAFIQMWTLADDSGRLRGNSRMLASILFPYDDDAPDLISGWLDELESEGCIVRYRDANDSAYIEICNWRSHQKIDKPSESKLPGPDSASIRESSRGLCERSRKIALDQGSRIKEGTKDQGPGIKDLERESEGKPGAIALPIKSSARFSAPSMDDLRTYCNEAGISLDIDLFYDHYKAQGWKLSNGRQMVDWQAAVRKWASRNRPGAATKEVAF